MPWSYFSKQNPIESLNAKKNSEAVLLYAFKIDLPASHVGEKLIKSIKILASINLLLKSTLCKRMQEGNMHKHNTTKILMRLL